MVKGVAVALALCTVACSARPVSTTQAPAAPATGAGSTLILSIVTTADLHGHVEALPWLGGHLRVLRELRAHDGGAVLLVDAGDMFQGTLESNPSEGAVVVRAYNALGYAAAAIGNHEFDYGPAGPLVVPAAPADNPRGALEARAREARFPFLASNVRAAAGPAWTAPNIAPSAMVDAAGVKVGFIGVTTMTTLQATDPRNLVGLQMSPIAATVTAEATELRKAGATVVVLLAHAGAVCRSFEAPDDISSCLPRPHQEIFDVARALRPGLVDAIAAGHTHQGVAHRVNGIPIVEAFAEGVAFGRIDLVIDRSSRTAIESRILPYRYVCDGTSRNPVPSTAPDACQPASYEGRAVAYDAPLGALLAPDIARAEIRRQKRLGVELATPFERKLRDESPVGNLVTDLMRIARPKADLALYNTGGLRANLPAGPLTFGALHRLMPFDNTMASVVLSAGDLGRAVVRSLEVGRIVAMSGLRGEVRCLATGPTLDWQRLDGRPIAPETPLTVATSGFLAADGDGVLTGLGGERVIEAGPPLYDLLADTLTARGGALSADDPAIFEAGRRRIAFPGTLPLRCPVAAPTLTR